MGEFKPLAKVKSRGITIVYHGKPKPKPETKNELQAFAERRTRRA